MHCRQRRGVAMVWATAVALLIVGFGSMAVDYGRVTLAKSQLQAATTAAARAAVAKLPNVAAAQTEAVTIAAANIVDGEALSLDANQDVEFLTWTESTGNMTPLGGAARSNANAIRVTARRTVARGNPIRMTLARAIGFSECDVQAVAVAKVSFIGYPFVGLDSVTLSGQGNTDSYNSAAGAYNAGSANRNGSVASNGPITVSGSSIVRGDARSFLANGVTTSGGGQVTGSKASLNSQLAFAPPVVPAGAYSAGAVSVSSGRYDIAAGEYHCTSLTVSNKATFNCLGPVRVYVSGPVNITGGYIGTYLNRPENFQIYVVNSSAVALNGQANFYGQIYAPLSDVTQGGSADIFGSIIARNLTFGGTWKGGAHADESLSYLGTPVIVTIK